MNSHLYYTRCVCYTYADASLLCYADVLTAATRAVFLVLRASTNVVVM
jgi:hypothetical protein